MARGGFERPPRWAVIVMVAGLAFLAVGIPYATGSNTSPDATTGPAPAATATPTTAAAPVAAFIGDSYTAGTGASDPAQRFTHVVSATEGWREVNDGRGGTGYISPVTGPNAKIACGLTYCPSYREMILAAVSQRPGIVMVSGGRNDIDEVDSAAYAAGVTDFYVSLRKALPNAKIIATSPVWDATATPEQIVRLGGMIGTAVRAVGGVYLDIGEPLAGHPELMGPDAVHPNDRGHRALAAAIIKALPR